MRRGQAPTRQGKPPDQMNAQMPDPRGEGFHPVLSLGQTQDPSIVITIDYSQPFRQYKVVYARCSNRKNKKWEGDGILKIQQTAMVLEEVVARHKQISSSYHTNKADLDTLESGDIFTVNGYEVEIQNEIIKRKFEEYVYLCQASDFQKTLAGRINTDMITLDESTCRDFITRLLAHPAVLYQRLQLYRQLGKERLVVSRLLDAYPADYNPIGCYVRDSGKLHALFKLVTEFDENNEPVVIASSSKSTLTLIEKLFEYIQFAVFRLDGKNPSVKEAQLKKFNRLRPDNARTIILLNAKTSVCGIGLDGSRKLILFDMDCWSPKEDIKTRIWESSKRYECQIYRLVTKDSIEEETLQTEGIIDPNSGLFPRSHGLAPHHHMRTMIFILTRDNQRAPICPHFVPFVDKFI